MPRPRSDLAPRIRAAARARFLLEGVDGASLRSIAQDAGTTIGMVYYYYATKDALFEAVVDEVYERLLADFSVALAPDAPVELRFQRMYDRVARMDDVEYDVIRILLREALVSSERLRGLVDRAVRGHLPWLLATVAEGRGDGQLDPELPLAVEVGAAMALSMLPQLVVRQVARSDLPTVSGMLPEPTALARHMHRVLLHGIAGPKQPGPMQAAGAASEPGSTDA